MRKNLFVALAVLIGFVFILAACTLEDIKEIEKKATKDNLGTTFSIAEIKGVTVPVAGGTPVTSITANGQYAGTVTWEPLDTTFRLNKQYKAKITLNAKKGYTPHLVKANFFKVEGAKSVENKANSGVITAEFPQITTTIINIPAIPGVTAPVTGRIPVKNFTGNVQYEGTVTWSPNHSTFASATRYTATITLTAKEGYTLKGAAASFFTVAGATSVSNAANSGVITAVFPATAATTNIKAIEGVTAPATGVVPVSSITETTQYTGIVTWSPTVSTTFAASTNYTATITLTAKAGYTLHGVGADFFTIAGTSSPATNAANTGEITAVFPITDPVASVNRFVYYWVDEHGSLVTTSGGVTSVLVGRTLTITAQGTGYTVKQWYLDGLNTGLSGNTYTFSSTRIGNYTVDLHLEKDSKLYSTSVTITVTAGNTVTFNANGGTGTAPASQTVAAGSGITLPDGNGLTKTGYTFGGWNTNASGTGTNYNAGSSYTPTSSVTLYAKWSTSIIEMVYVSGGSFVMGQELGTAGSGNVTPTHTVTLTGFYMGKYEVTQSQYQSVMGSNPSSSYGVGNNYPVYYVSWYDAIVFCNKLSMAEGLTPAYSISGSTNPSNWGSVPTSSNSTWNSAAIVSGSTGYRLPTEAQWEYAAKGGASPGAYTYSGSNTVGNVAWYSSNSSSRTHEVGTKEANGLGLYDMSGNVWEWCWDWYGSYSSSAQTDPVGASSGSDRVVRGGFWYNDASYVRSVSRSNGILNNRVEGIGIRLVRP
jgi:uncharacterized repeat protein (TIGR02543 family)